MGMGENLSVTNLGVFGTVEIQVRVGCPLLVCDGFDVVVDARDEDLAVDGDESRHELNQICHRLVDRTTEHARVEISFRACHWIEGKGAR